MELLTRYSQVEPICVVSILRTSIGARGRMAQADLEPVGRWERLIQPYRNKLTIHAEMGLDTRLDPDASKAAAEAFSAMARYIDLMEAHERATRQFVKSLAVTLLLIGAFGVMAYLA